MTRIKKNRVILLIKQRLAGPLSLSPALAPNTFINTSQLIYFCISCKLWWWQCGVSVFLWVLCVIVNGILLLPFGTVWENIAWFNMARRRRRRRLKWIYCLNERNMMLLVVSKPNHYFVVGADIVERTAALIYVFIFGVYCILLCLCLTVFSLEGNM